LSDRTPSLMKNSSLRESQTLLNRLDASDGWDRISEPAAVAKRLLK